MQMNTFWDDTSLTEKHITSTTQGPAVAGCSAQAYYGCLCTNYAAIGAVKAWLREEERAEGAGSQLGSNGHTGGQTNKPRGDRHALDPPPLDRGSMAVKIEGVSLNVTTLNPAEVTGPAVTHCRILLMIIPLQG